MCTKNTFIKSRTSKPLFTIPLCDNDDNRHRKQASIPLFGKSTKKTMSRSETGRVPPAADPPERRGATPALAYPQPHELGAQHDC